MKPKAQEHPAFIRFWEDTWRRHARKTDGRRAARETFMKHVKEGADPDDIADGAAYFIRNLSKEDAQFIPLASTWLNRGAYEDMCMQERDYQIQRREAQKQREQRVQAAPAPRPQPKAVEPIPERKRDVAPHIQKMLAEMGCKSVGALNEEQGT